ncbi:MAG: hypothetical protein V3V49_11170 [Candidatus Krumholzibacteria bacterium]
MVRPTCTVALALVVAWTGTPSAVEWPPFDPVTVGARFEYFVQVDREAVPFPWNASSRSAQDRTRLMLDLTALGTEYGSLYVKGAALRDGSGERDMEARFRFEQGDYLWAQQLDKLDYSLRLFANERRFFVSDMIAPLLDDDSGRQRRESRGARLDGRLGDRVDVSALYSRLGDDFDDARAVTYLRGAYAMPWAVLSTSYLFDDPGAFGVRNQALFKTELSAAYRRAYAVVSYEQSAFKDGNLFFPGGNFHFDRFDGDNFSAILPEGSALVAEARVRAIPLRQLGAARLVYRYTAVGDRFMNDLGRVEGTGVGHMAAVYFRARTVSLDARLRYQGSVRSRLENEERDTWDAALWGMFQGGVEFFLRSGVSRVDDQFAFDSKSNFIHFALHHQMKRMQSGAHIMWKDLDTVFSERRFAWDGKLAMSPDWGLHWRFAVARGTNVRKAVFSRLEYRPNDRVYATFGYGQDFLGDAPYLLEDEDLDLGNPASAVYTISVRGDF